MSDPLAYFITFRTYGTWLHGDERGSVDPEHNIPGTPKLPSDERWLGSARKRMLETRFELNTASRRAVDQAIRERCFYAGWSLLALNVRTNHVHVLVAATEPADQVMTARHGPPGGCAHWGCCQGARRCGLATAAPSGRGASLNWRT